MSRHKLKQLEDELKKLVSTIEINCLNDEEGELQKILDEIKIEGDDSNIDKLKHRIWEYYRKYKFKEFIFKFYQRISAEIDTVDKNAFKTVEMIDRAFCWYITEAGEGNSKKYNQRYYSRRVLEIPITKKMYNDGKVRVKNHLLKTTIKDEYSKENEVKQKEEFEKKLSEENYIVQNVLKTINEEEEQKNFIHSIAQITGIDIQLDHVLQRELIKKIIEELCKNLMKKNNDCDRAKLISKEINFLYPLMFGCVVTKNENHALKQFSKRLTTEYLKQLGNDEKNKIIGKSAEQIESEITSENDRSKKLRKDIAERLFWQYWKQEKQDGILKMLYQNYELCYSENKDNDSETIEGIKLCEIKENNFIEITGFELQEES